MRFTIQAHHAHKAGLHWDLRLEYPSGDLGEYAEKRNFEDTAEPFALGQGAVMKSWAIPKAKLPGVGERVLAVPVEDHPLSYQDFQGEIPEGSYGAGGVELIANGDYGLESYNPDKDHWLFSLPGFGRFKIVPFKDKNALIIGLEEKQ